MGVTQVKLIDQADIVCPAGTALGGDTVFCGVEQQPIGGHLNPDTVENRCCSRYEGCTTWRAEKDRIAARRREPLIPGGVS